MKPSSQTPAERKTPQGLAVELLTTTQRMTNGERDARRLLEALRAEVLGEAIEAARGEYLTDATGDETDEAYNRGVSDAIAAIDALLDSERGGAR